MSKSPFNGPDRMQGLTLIELMIALVLGLVVVAGVGSVMLANRQTYNTNLALSDVQESVRSAFELLAYDVRQAGGTPCGTTINFANTVKPASAQATENWWQSMRPVFGYDGNQTSPAVAFAADVNAVPQRVPNTDAITLAGTDTTLDVTVNDHQANSNSATLFISNPTPDIQDGDILLVCDFKQTTIFQVTNYQSTNNTVVANTGISQTPGNCTKNLTGNFDCSLDPNTATSSTGDFFDKNQTFISRPSSVTWYIGQNGRADDGGRSLYQISLQHRPTRGIRTVEIASGVTDMQLRYKTRTSADFVTADTLTSPGAWEAVDAVEITLTLQSATQGASTSASNQGRLSRQVSTVVAMRNRVE
ncbi:MAG: prepilin-type N-terminal cleavage/methylation domain-containing protein [Thauera sp.]